MMILWHCYFCMHTTEFILVTKVNDYTNILQMYTYICSLMTFMHAHHTIITGHERQPTHNPDYWKITKVVGHTAIRHHIYRWLGAKLQYLHRKCYSLALSYRYMRKAEMCYDDLEKNAKYFVLKLFISTDEDLERYRNIRLLSFIKCVATHTLSYDLDDISQLFPNRIFFAITVRCHYNAGNFNQILKSHPVDRPLGQGMGYPLWVQPLIKFHPSRCSYVHNTYVSLHSVIMPTDCTMFWWFVSIHVILLINIKKLLIVPNCLRGMCDLYRRYQFNIATGVFFVKRELNQLRK